MTDSSTPKPSPYRRATRQLGNDGDNGGCQAYAAADDTAMWLVWNVESRNALDLAHKTLPSHGYLQSEIVLQDDNG